MVESEQNSELIKHLENEYFSILQNIENHTEYDYLKLRFSLRNDNKTTLPPFSNLDWFHYSGDLEWLEKIYKLGLKQGRENQKRAEKAKQTKLENKRHEAAQARRRHEEKLEREYHENKYDRPWDKRF